MKKILVVGAASMGTTLLEDKRYKIFKQILPYISYSKGVLSENNFETTFLYPIGVVKASELQMPDVSKYAAILTVDTKSTTHFMDGIYQSLLEVKGVYEGVPVFPIKIPFSLSDATPLAFRLGDIVSEVFDKSESVKPPATDVTIIEDIFQWAGVLQECRDSGTVSFDVETNQIDDKNRTLFYYDKDFKVKTLAVSPYAGKSYVLSVEHEETAMSFTDVLVCLNSFIDLLESKEVTKIAHNLKYDLNALLKYYGNRPVKYRGRYADTMLMAHLYNENERASLENCVNLYLPTFSGYKISNYNIALNDLAKYNGQDTDMTIRLFYFFEIVLRQDDCLYYIHRNLQMTVFWQLLTAERTGALIDKNYLEDSIRDGKLLVQTKKKSLSENEFLIKYCQEKKKILKDCKKAEIEFKLKTSKMTNHWQTKLEALDNEEFDYEFNFNSIPQLQDFLYLSLHGLRLTAYDENNNVTVSTDKDALATLNHEFVDTLKEYRGLEKVIKTFFVGIYNKLDKNNVLHTNFNIHGTRTGRLSASEPNLQNQITRTQLKDEEVAEMILRVKKFFIPLQGYKILQADFSQLELKLIAMFSKDVNMIEAYKNNMDLHCLTGSQINNMEYEDFMAWKESNSSIYKLQRFCGKGANFSLSYGCSADTYRVYVKAMTGVVIDKDTAVVHHTNFFKNYPAMLSWHRTYIKKAKTFGYVRTFFGRKRNLTDINSKLPEYRSAAERQAINAPVQGTGGELALFLIVIVNKILGDKAIMFNTVHDSFIYYVKEENIEYTKQVLKYVTANLPNFFKHFFNVDLSQWVIPLGIDIEVGDSWGSLKE